MLSLISPRAGARSTNNSRAGQAAIHAQASPSRQAAIGGHTPSPSQLPHSHTPHPQQGAVTRQPLIGQFAQPHTGRRKKGKGTGTPGAARRSEQPDTTPPSAGSFASGEPAQIDPHIMMAQEALPADVLRLMPAWPSCATGAPDGLFREASRHIEAHALESGPGAGAWLTAVPYADSLRIPEAQWQVASCFRLGLPIPQLVLAVETFGCLSEPLRQFLGLCASRTARRRRDSGAGDDGSARIFETSLTTRLSVALQRAQANVIMQHAVRQLGGSDNGWMPAPANTSARRAPTSSTPMATGSKAGTGASRPAQGTHPVGHTGASHRNVCLQLRDQMARVFLASQQFGVGVTCGTEVTVRGVVRALADHPGWVVLQLDVANAFNSFFRDVFATAGRVGRCMDADTGTAWRRQLERTSHQWLL
ncbi:hypothetical protein CLOP_g10517 [Closterium sp. NIES-67]|nr:hypothetical protein CLOP_g10517 [Closterium sp. NIES-67]